ncbi:MAG: hypothetical protein H6729_17590 [Deltaproteobacteria bacterium]|nr:hypothetical protein [Deltaproteobacteria bacterium]
MNPNVRSMTLLCRHAVAVLAVFAVFAVGTGCSGDSDCPNCLDPNVADYRLSVVGDFCASSAGASVAGLLAVNLNSVPDAVEPLADSDGDGVSDLDEAELGSVATLKDSDGDRFSDLVEVRLRAPASAGNAASGDADILDPDVPQPGGCDASSDADADLLADCEETRLGLRTNRIDTDDDGIIDAIELRFGTNPALADTDDDLDADGVSNGFEIQSGTHPKIVDRARAAKGALTYSLVITTPDDPIQCVAFEVGNIELKVTTPDGTNRILLHRRMNTGEGIVEHRFTCALTRFPGTLSRTEPKGGRLRIPEAAWYNAPLEAMAHCVCPNGDLDGC